MFDGVLEGVKEHRGVTARTPDDQGELVALTLQIEQKTTQLLVDIQKILVDKVNAVVIRGDFFELLWGEQFREHVDEGVVISDQVGFHCAAVNAENRRLVQKNLPFSGVVFNTGNQ